MIGLREKCLEWRTSRKWFSLHNHGEKIMGDQLLSLSHHPQCVIGYSSVLTRLSHPLNQVPATWKQLFLISHISFCESWLKTGQ